jgi:photosystem II stability/assembly factor-like uncharacterized protein
VSEGHVAAGRKAKESIPSTTSDVRPVSNIQPRHSPAGQAAAPAAKAAWAPISDGVLKRLGEEGKKPSWPGGTAGVSVDPATGDVRLIVPDQGLWNSSDRGATFARVDGGSIGGRCETGFALNADPAGGRLACFMLDGPSAITLDNGKTWSAFQQHGRGWDFGAVDWSTKTPRHILAVHHEADGELLHSEDGGKSWKLIGKNYTAVGIFDAGAFVTSQGDGILRSVDGGLTWAKVSDHTPTGRILCVLKGVGYWVSREGLLVSTDRGATWTLQGMPIEAAWGPFFGKSSKQIVVVGKMGGVAGFWKSRDAGQTWKLAAPWPNFAKESPPDWTASKQWAAGWFYNFGWDPTADRFYASRMGHPTFKYPGD